MFDSAGFRFDPILLVDPDQIHLNTVRELLSKYWPNLEVYEAHNGHEALEYLSNIDYSLVISEMSLPDMSGAQLLKQYRKMMAGKSAPFFFLANESDEQQISEVLKNGAMDYMVHPYRPEHLYYKIRNIFRFESESEASSRVKHIADNLVNSSMDMIIATDSERRIIEFNSAAEQKLGYSRSEIIGKHINVLYKDKSTSKYLAELANDRDQFTAAIINLTKDGDEVPVFLSASKLMDKHGEIIGYMGVSRDLKDEEYVEEAIKEAQESARKSDKAKSAFLASISHELRTPLQTIIGYSDLLLRQEELADTQRSQLNVIHSGGVYLSQLVNNVIDLTQLESGDLEMDQKPFHLTDEIAFVKNICKPKADQKGLKFHVNVQPESRLMLQGDPTRLRQILINLATNAIKFTSEGAVSLEVDTSSASDGHGGSGILFRVKDSGIGISPDNISSIFKPFYMGEEDEKEERGIGFGLYLCKRLTEIMGGQIHVESEPGKGSIFSVRIPFSVVSHNAVRAQGLKSNGRSHTNAKQGKLLLLNTLDTNKQYYLNLLKSVSNPTSYVDTLDAYTAELKGSEIHTALIVADLSTREEMKRLGHIHSALERTEIPVILIATNDNYPRETSRLNVFEYIKKPFSTDRLIRALNSHVGVTLANRSDGTERFEEDVIAFMDQHEDPELSKELAEAIIFIDLERVCAICQQFPDSRVATQLCRMANTRNFRAILNLQEYLLEKLPVDYNPVA